MSLYGLNAFCISNKCMRVLVCLTKYLNHLRACSTCNKFYIFVCHVCSHCSGYNDVTCFSICSLLTVHAFSYSELFLKPPVCLNNV